MGSKSICPVAEGERLTDCCARCSSKRNALCWSALCLLLISPRFLNILRDSLTESYCASGVLSLFSEFSIANQTLRRSTCFHTSLHTDFSQKGLPSNASFLFSYLESHLLLASCRIQVYNRCGGYARISKKVFLLQVSPGLTRFS